eukprot:s369_g27.t1
MDIAGFTLDAPRSNALAFCNIQRHFGCVQICSFAVLNLWNTLLSKVWVGKARFQCHWCTVRIHSSGCQSSRNNLSCLRSTWAMEMDLVPDERPNAQGDVAQIDPNQS